MKLLILALAAVAAGERPGPCPVPRDFFSEKRVFTNADLEMVAACRGRTGALSQPEAARPEPGGARRPGATPPETDRARRDATEADWRARWRSIDQRARRLRQEASELRQEAAAAPRDPRKRPTGRRSPSVLIARAEAREKEARDLEDEFHQQARRAGALPGWLRP